jgi:hypothetical protein
MCIKAAALAAAAAGSAVLATASSRFCDDSARSHVLSWAVDTRTVQHQRYVAKLPAHAKRARAELLQHMSGFNLKTIPSLPSLVMGANVSAVLAGQLTFAGC